MINTTTAFGLEAILQTFTQYVTGDFLITAVILIIAVILFSALLGLDINLIVILVSLVGLGMGYDSGGVGFGIFVMCLILLGYMLMRIVYSIVSQN